MVINASSLYSPRAFKAAHLRCCASKCCVLKAVSAFAFSLSPIKLVTYNKQWLNMVLFSSLLKIWTLNTKRDGVVKAVFDFWKFKSFITAKNSSYKFPWKMAKVLLLVCQILRNFTEGNARKFNLSLGFLCSFWYLKISSARRLLKISLRMRS